MASIVVYIENDGERPTPESLQALGQGRRIASALGATLYAFAVQSYSESEPVNGPSKQEQRGRLVQALGNAGVDKVAMMPLLEQPGPHLWAQHGVALHTACERIQPRVVLFMANCAGRDLAPRLAARLQATYVAEPAIEFSDNGNVVLARAITGPGAGEVRRISLEDLPGCTIVTLTPGTSLVDRGDEEAEVLTLDPPDDVGKAGRGGIQYIDSVPDPGADLEDAAIIVVAGGGVRDAEGYALVGRLAEALGGRLAATRTLADRGIAPRERIIGLGARHVVPSVYVVCAASGSPEHLAAVRKDAVIVAIDSDPGAPIFQVSSYGVVGSIEQVIPDLIAALSSTSAPSSTT